MGQLCRSVALVSEEYRVAGTPPGQPSSPRCPTRRLPPPRRSRPSPRGRRALLPRRHPRAPDHLRQEPGGPGSCIVIDLFEGKSAAKLRRWCAGYSERWLKGVRVVALASPTPPGQLHPHLSHAKRVADPFHVTHVANRTLPGAPAGPERYARAPRPQGRSALSDSQNLVAR